MSDSNNKRDILDLDSKADFPAENMPVKTERPMAGNHDMDTASREGDEGDFFLDRFLGSEEDKATAAPADDEATSDAPVRANLSPEARALRETIIEALREIYDPEIPVNIYELGLIYEVNVADDSSAEIVMTLTTPHCPVAESMPGEIEMKVASVPGVSSASVALVWEPPWDMSLMSDEARLELGLL